MKYKFEKDIEQNLMSIDVVDAQRCAHAIRHALKMLEDEARGYGFHKKDFYLDTQAFLENMITRLSAEVGRY